MSSCIHVRAQKTILSCLTMQELCRIHLMQERVLHESFCSGPLEWVLVKTLPDKIHKLWAMLVSCREGAGFLHYLQAVRQ